MAEELVTVVVIVVEVAGRKEAEEAVDAVVAELGDQVARRYPLEEYTKFPNCWKAVVHLAPVVDDAAAAVARVSVRLAAKGWGLDSADREASTVWDRRQTRRVRPGNVLVHPAVAWVLIEAFPPPDPNQAPTEFEELLPDEPEYGWGGMDDDWYDDDEQPGGS